MSEPVTSLDARFSEPGSTATPWETTLQVLKAAELSWITTVRHDGRPHVSPLVTVWFDGALWFSTGATEQKAVNLHTSRHVVVTTGCNSWDRGLDVVVEGEATRETDDGVLAQLAKAWSAKWDGRWQYEARDGAFHHPGGGEALVFRVAPAQGPRIRQGRLHSYQLPVRYTDGEKSHLTGLAACQPPCRLTPTWARHSSLRRAPDLNVYI
jgi:general stress protein 26